MRKYKAFLFCIIFSVSGICQEQMGIAHSNYVPTDGVFVNPAGIIDSKTWLDIHVIGLDVFAYNNYAHIANYSLLKAAANPEVAPAIGFRYEPGRTFRGDFLLNLKGPGFVVGLGKHALGFHSSVRSYSDFKSVPASVAKFMQEGLKYGPQHNINYNESKFKISSLTWAEFGLSYAALVKHREKNLWLAGLSAKYLVGISAIAMNVKNLDYTVLNDSNLVIRNFDAEIGVNQPAWNAGKGWAVDAGVIYKRTLTEVDRYEPHWPEGDCGVRDYEFKIGLSLLDVGRIKFKKAAYYQSFTSANTYWENYNKDVYDGAESVDQNLNGNMDNNESRSETADNFAVWLPSAISGQFDYRYIKNVYFNGTIIQGFRMPGKFSKYRRSTIAFTPRYESRWFEIGIPFALHDYRKPMIGATFRIAILVIGTDNLIPLFINSNVNQASFYFSVKVPIFKNPFCGKGNRDKRNTNYKWKKGTKTNCPDF